ncbi:MAG TPA: hypothetical protein VG897_02470 [Terriglobales bacterium]|nr:hypothetical protein [Terriglobales bacterium]
MRLLRQAVPASSEPVPAGAIPSTGKALSFLGVNSPVADPELDHIVPVADPIKRPAYLQDEDIPEIPRSIAEPEVELAPEPKVEQPVPQQSKVPTTISGPSFLGLASGPASDDSADYLLQDDRPRRGGWLVFAFVAILVFVAIGWLEWNTIKTGHIKLPFGLSSNSASAPQSATPQANASNTTSADSSATPASGEQEKLSTVDSSSASTASESSDAKAATAYTETTPPDANDTTSAAKPNDATPANDAAAVHASQARQAKEAKQRREAPDEDSSQPEPDKSPARTPEREKKPDPQQNKMLQLGEKYLYGRGVPANCQQALVYFRAAAEQNNAPAMAHLGALYNSGQCVKQDRPQAYTWLKHAHDADPSNQWIEHDMNLLWRDMSTQERAGISR